MFVDHPYYLIPKRKTTVNRNICLSLPGVFQAVKIRNEQGQKDMYVDGGILCNYPVHVFDGKIQKK